MILSSHSHTIVNPLVNLLGITYFALWSYSFYPQIILNYRRKSTVGFSADYAFINPLGFFALTLWNAFTLFSPLVRKQYQGRHDGHDPSVSLSDLAFSLHALLASLVMLSQGFYYARKGSVQLQDEEERPLLPNKIETEIMEHPSRPSFLCQVAVAGIFIGALIAAILVWTDKMEFLDWLYYASSVKLFISLVKYMPQVYLNWRKSNLRGFAIGNIIADAMGSVLSFAQLVIASVYIEHDAGGIIANPAKLGLSGLSFGFDVIFLLQKYYWFREKKVNRTVEEAEDR